MFIVRPIIADAQSWLRFNKRTGDSSFPSSVSEMTRSDYGWLPLLCLHVFLPLRSPTSFFLVTNLLTSNFAFLHLSFFSLMDQLMLSCVANSSPEWIVIIGQRTSFTVRENLELQVLRVHNLFLSSSFSPFLSPAYLSLLLMRLLLLTRSHCVLVLYSQVCPFSLHKCAQPLMCVFSWRKAQAVVLTSHLISCSANERVAVHAVFG